MLYWLWILLVFVLRHIAINPLRIHAQSHMLAALFFVNGNRKHCQVTENQTADNRNVRAAGKGQKETKGKLRKLCIIAALSLILAAAVSAVIVGGAAVLSNRGEAGRNAQKSAEELRVPRQAYELCLVNSFNTPVGFVPEGIQSGWEVDNRAGVPKTVATDNGIISDVMTDEHSRLLRYFNTVTEGKLDIQFRANYADNFNGNVLCLCDESGSYTYYLVTKEDTFWLLNRDGSYSKLYDGSLEAPCDVRFRVIVDLDKGTSATYLNVTTPAGGNARVECASHPLTGSAVRYLSFETLDETINTTEVFGGHIQANYAVYEDFFDLAQVSHYIPAEGVQPDGNQFTGDGVLTRTNDCLCLGVPQSGSAERAFDCLGGKVCFDFNVFLPDGSAGGFSLCADDTPIVTISAKDGALYANGDRKLKDFSDRLWYAVRIEADMDMHRAVIKLNNRMVDTVDFLAETNYVSQIRFENLGTTIISVDDIVVYNLLDYEIEAPTVPEGADDYTIGINVCPIWENGAPPAGWSVVTAHDELKPVLGYYDEGLPETADWEIKFMVEHGIDFQAFCWYSDNSDCPIKYGRYSKHLDDGFLNAEYGDMMKFCLLWEAYSAEMPADSDAFRNYFVPYWIEYYFSNPRYMTIDNQPIMAIFGTDTLIETFGTALKDDLDYLRQEVKKLGFDGLIILACNGGRTDYADYGMDGWYPYNWSRNGYSYDYNVSENTKAYESKNVYAVPTVSVGFSGAAWSRVKTPLMTVEDFKKINEWVKAQLSSRTDIPNWAEGLAMLASWNEYGEGTYIMPCEDTNGFGYLDVVREVYTQGGAHEDITPTETQLASITHNYPQDRRLLRQDGSYTIPKGHYTVTYDFTQAEAYGIYLKPEHLSSEVSVSADGTTYATLPDGESSDATLTFDGKLYSGLTAENIRSVRIVASGIPVGQKVQLYYAANGGWLTEDKTVNLISQTEEETELVFELENRAGWTGEIAKLRFDPLTLNNASFTIKSISFDVVGCEKRFDFTQAGAYSTYLRAGNLSAAVSVSENGTTYTTLPAGQSSDVFLTLDEKMFAGLTADEVVRIHVVASGIPAGESMQLYISTNGSALNESNSMKVLSTTAEKTEFVFEMSHCAAWKGKITGLRLDPMQRNGVSFTIRSISFETVACEKQLDFTRADAYQSYLRGEHALTVTGTDDGGTVFTTLPSGQSSDAYFYIKESVFAGIPAEELIRIRVVASGIPAGQKAQLYYATNGAGLSEDRSISAYSTSAEETELIFTLEGEKEWSGTISTLRLDPLTRNDTTFTIRSITFELREPRPALYVNDTQVSGKLQIETVDGVDYFPFEPGESLIHYYLYVYHEWDYDTATLTLYRDGNSYCFTVGKDYALVDGQEQIPLGGKIYQRNNIPMIPIRGLAKALGMHCVQKDGNYYIDTPEKPLFGTGGDGIWTFDTAGNSLGWRAANAVVGYGENCLRLTSYQRSDKNYDPQLYLSSGLNLDCSQYRTLEIKCKWSISEKQADYFGAFFVTDAQSDFSQVRYVQQTISAASDGYQIITLQMSDNPYWTGTLTKLRLDPFSAAGVIDIAYIRFREADDSKVLVQEDAEGTNSFTSPNAYVEIVTDPEAWNNHCYHVTQRTEDAYLYAYRAATFVPNATYQIDFDVMLDPEGKNESGKVWCNMQYADAAGSNGIHHLVKNILLTKSDGWVHYSATYTVSADSTDRASDLFTIYSDPQNGNETAYYFDNVKVARVG